MQEKVFGSSPWTVINSFWPRLTTLDPIVSAENLDLRHAQSQLVIIDEIGKMECLSRHFTDEVTTLLNSPKMLIATIAMRGEGFINQVKQRSDCRLVTVTRENRDSLANELLQDVLDHLR